MSEEKIMESGNMVLRKQIMLAKLKRSQANLAEVLKLENEILDLRRSINRELDKITKIEQPKVDIIEETTE